MSSTTFQAVNPTTGESLPGQFTDASLSEINQTVENAAMAFEAYRHTGPAARAEFLERIAAEIEALGDELLERCHQETGLPMGRLQGERGRTANQLRLFAKVVREGSWVDARIDPAQPDRQPLPRADIRHMQIALGPVVVFGASNFPLAFSTAGGDTAAALAAGCPVVVKGHPAHPGTHSLVAGAILKAIEATGMPEGTFGSVQGRAIEVGKALVMHPQIKAVGFTGSFRGGTAIFEYANSRPEPIPVFAEMGSTNPVFILPGALKERGAAIADGLAASLNLGVGQFCTNPGLSFLPDEPGKDAFLQTLEERIGETGAGTMLTAGIKAAYDKGIERLAGTDSVRNLAGGAAAKGDFQAQTAVFRTTTEVFLAEESLEEEVFGPSGIVVESGSREQLLASARRLKGHLTATVHGTEADLIEYRELFDILEKKVGRIIVNGFPTGVEVCHSMVHGGPYPATTATQSTSVGTTAIRRFVRPVCYQDLPQALLPDALKDNNPLGIWRLVDGQFTQAAL